MTDFPALLAPDRGQPAQRVRLVAEAEMAAFRESLGETARAAVAAAGFAGRPDSAVFLPEDGGGWSLAVGLGREAAAGRWTLAAAAAALPAGTYRLEGPAGPHAAHGWLMAQHRFDRYRRAEDQRGARQLLVAPHLVDRAVADAAAAAALRDMVDTPAEDMGPDDIEAAVRELAGRFDAAVEAVSGEALLERNLPLIHAVGRASPRRPRLVMLDWAAGPDLPLLVLVGKGVAFDSGGLNLKTGGSMALMKKDMGGAAHALMLARLVMERRLPVRLKLLVAAADNMVAGNALRPGDVITSRKGLSVEVGNTDAEGRLLLADALALASEAGPALILDFATLTGAARVALGPELPALFANDDGVAAALLEAGAAADDPLWRLPLWAPYAEMFRSTIADLNNNAEGGMAGAITAALFLERFVAPGTAWAHLDLYAWSGSARPGRPKGGAATGLFAALGFLERRFAA